jgi:hypothetical protein
MRLANSLRDQWALPGNAIRQARRFDRTLESLGKPGFDKLG